MPENQNKFITSFLVWFIIFSLFFLILKNFTATKQVSKTPAEPVFITLSASKYSLGSLALFTIHNQQNIPLVFQSPCGDLDTNPNLAVYGFVNGQKISNSVPFKNCTQSDFPNFEVAPYTNHQFSFPTLSNKLFSNSGEYVVEMIFADKTAVKSPRFYYKKPNTITKWYRELVTKPLFNLLVFFEKTLPTHSLGWAIICLTIFVKILLFVPNKKAVVSQLAMENIQPELLKIRKKYKSDSQLLALKTMELYKTHKVHPFSAIFPLLIQFPILLGVYWIIRQEVSVHHDNLLYSFNQGLDLGTIEHSFGWFDVTQPDALYVLPVVVFVLQMISMRLGLNFMQKKLENKKNKPSNKHLDMQKKISWFIPVMVGVFALNLPAGISLYWAVSTLFGIGQQAYVRKKVYKL